MPFTYILKSKTTKKTYVGSTVDLNRHIKEHNFGLSKFTSRYKPWYLLYREEFDNISSARKKEKYFKTAAGRRFIKKVIGAENF